MSFDDSTSESTACHSQRRCHFVLALGRDEAFFTTFLRLKLAAVNLRRGPNPRLKLAAAYFSHKEVVRLCRRSRLILAAAYLSRGLFSLV